MRVAVGFAIVGSRVRGRASHQLFYCSFSLAGARRGGCRRVCRAQRAAPARREPHAAATQPRAAAPLGLGRIARRRAAVGGWATGAPRQPTARRCHAAKTASCSCGSSNRPP
eukprot:7042828-Prymnesium_polylepis.1